MVVIEGAALRSLIHSIEHRRLAGIPVYKVSVDDRNEGVAIKVNEACWSATLSTAPEPEPTLPFAD